MGLWQQNCGTLVHLAVTSLLNMQGSAEHAWHDARCASSSNISTNIPNVRLPLAVMGMGMQSVPGMGMQGVQRWGSYGHR